MAEIRFRCPQCERKLAVKESFGGLTVPCPACAKPITIPKFSELPPKVAKLADKAETQGTVMAAFTPPAAAPAQAPAPAPSPSTAPEVRAEIEALKMENRSLRLKLDAAERTVSEAQRLDQEFKELKHKGDQLDGFMRQNAALKDQVETLNLKLERRRDEENRTAEQARDLEFQLGQFWF